MDQIGLQAVFEDSNFQAGLARYTAGLTRAENATGRAASAMTAFGHTISTAIGTALGMLSMQLLPRLENALMAPINATRAWGSQLDELGDIFGLTSTNATGFAVALNKVGVSVQDGMSGFSYFTRQVATTEDQLQTAAETFQRAAADIGASHADAMKQIAEGWAQAQAEASASIAAVWAELGDKRAEIESNLSETLAGIWENLNERRAEIESNLSETLAGIWDNLKEQRAAIEKDLAATVANIQEDLADRTLSIQERLNERLSDLAEQRASLYQDTADALADVDANLAKRLRTVRSPRERRELKQEAAERKAQIEEEAAKREAAIAKQEQKEREQAEKQIKLAEETARKQEESARRVAAEQIAANEVAAQKQAAAAEAVAAKQIAAAEKVAAKQAEQAEKTAAKQIAAAEKAAQKQTEAIEKALAKQEKLMEKQQEQAAKSAGQALAKAKQALSEVETRSPLAKALAQLGLTFQQVSDESRPFTDRLGDIMDAFAKLPDGVDTSSIALQLFGRSGLQWLDFLRQGRQGLEDARKLGIDLGLVLDPKQVEQYNRSLDMFNLIWQSIGVNLGKVVLPIAQDILTTFNKFMTSEAIPALSNLMDRLSAAYKKGGLEGLWTELWTALTEPKGLFDQLGALITRIRDWFQKGDGRTLLLKAGETFSAILDGFRDWANSENGKASIKGVTEAIGNAMMAGIKLVFAAAQQVADVMNALSDSMLLWVNSPDGQNKIRSITEAVVNAVFAGIQLLFAKNDKGDLTISTLISNLLWSIYRTIKNIADIGGSIAGTIIGGIVGYFFGAEAGTAIKNSLTTTLSNVIMQLCAPGMFFANLGVQVANAIYTGLTKGWGDLIGNFNPFGDSKPKTSTPKSSGLPLYDIGGWVRRTGPAIVHAGEYVLNPMQARVMAPALASMDSRSYNISFNNTWNGNAGAIERSEIETLVERTANRAFRQIIRMA